MIADRIKETTTTTGTGAVDLAGAQTAFETFVAGIGDGNTCYYCIQSLNLGEWEVGIGIVTDASPDTLSRDTILQSSNADALVDFSAGTKDVFVVLPADKVLYRDADGNTPEEFTSTPQLESIYNNEYRDAGHKRFTVSDDGITRVHDIVNDPARQCIWGVTRSNTAVNYVFRMDRDGTITKAALGGSGENLGMFIAWGGDYLWAAILSSPGQLLRIDPDTLDLTFYELDPAADGATSLTYDGTYIFVGTFQNTGTDATIFRFNVSSEVIDEYTVSDVIEVYWALYDGTSSWFAGEHPSTGFATLIKIATDGTYSTYDLGANTSGSSITYDGTYIWHGSNDGADKNIIRFDTRDNSILVTPTNFAARLVGFDGQVLWWVDKDDSYTRMNTQSSLIEEFATLSGCTYTHGLTFDGLNAWIGTWQDTCYIYRVPMVPFSTNSIGGLEKSADPAEPAEGGFVIWMSDGTGKGDDGDVLIASKAGGATKYATLFDHSGGDSW